MNDKLLTLLMGKKWHERSSNTQRYRKPSPCACGKQYTAMKNLKKHFTSVNPDFSDPCHLYEFFTWLCRERREMWEGFTDWIDAKGERDLSIPAPWLWSKLIPWLFFSDPARPRDLMAEWLQLDSTIRRFGYEQGELTVEAAWDDGDWGTGKCTVLSEWAKYVKEAK